MKIIGITGTSGAGKGTVVEYLVNKLGYKHYSVGDYLIEEIQNRNLEVNRDSQREVANEIRKTKGGDFIVKELFQLATINGGNAIIESIRNPKEVDFIKRNNGILIAVNADQKIRYERIKLRKSVKDHVTFEHFKEQENKELQNTDPDAQNLPKCLEMADYVIDNNGDLNNLYEKIEEIINKQ